MLSLNILLIIFTSCIIKPSTGINTPKGVYGIKIDSNWLFWNYDWKEKWIKFQIEGIFKADEWFAFGFSDRGDLYNADYCIFYTNSEGKRDVIDAYTDDKCLLQIDKQQHCLDFHYQKLKRLSRFVFIREFDSCDGHDYVIEPGTAHIVWVRGKGGLKVNQNMCNHELSGMVRTTLLRVEPEDVQDQYVWNFTGTVDNLDVPPVETTYWCHTLELPMYITKRKQHLIKFEPVISRGSEAYVHHMELFHCEKDDASEVGALPRYSGLCTEKPKELEVCKKVIAAWAMGASPFVYPKKAGLPIGGHGYSTHVMLEIHYNNPHRDSIVDSSGLRIYVTPNLRPFDAGVIELGLEYIDKMAIPPKQEKFELTAYCVEECTNVGLPSNGIFIFASQLHTHLTGRKVETILVKEGVEVMRMDYDNHYSPHYQEIRLLRDKVHVAPGNALITRCTYNTMDRNNITLGGFATTDEMCVNYIYYYPKVDLEVCKSSISDFALAKYFNNLKEMEQQNTGSNMPISESYQNIEWTPLRVKILDELYHRSSLYMQCNRSNGDRFPGKWSDTPVTTVIQQLPPTQHCTLPYFTRPKSRYNDKHFYDTFM